MDLSHYDFTRVPSGDDPDWCIDELHRQALFAMAMHCTTNVVEIGCFRGFSTAAFIEAMNQGAPFTLHLVDIKITDELRRVVSMCKHPERVRIHETHATDFRLTDRPVDLFFIDGDHNFAACQDVLNAIVSDAGIIAMHDTQSHRLGIPQCEGAFVAAEALKAWPSRQYVEDAKKRPGQWTHRGFLASFGETAPLSAISPCHAVLSAP